MLYKAFDKSRDCDVAIKMEREDKSRSILVQEYYMLTKLKDVEGVVQVFDFVSQQH